MQPNKNFYAYMDLAFKELGQTFLNKNDGQYAKNCYDPLINFAVGAQMKYGERDFASMYEIAHDYARKHLAHLQLSSIDSPKIRESLTDIAIYCMIMRYMVDTYAEEQGSQKTCEVNS